MSDKNLSRRNKEIDGIRSIFWYHWIANIIDSEHPEDVRRAVEPNKSTLSADGGPDKNGKFSHYRKGMRMPNASLINQAELLIPGSSAVITHPLWKILRQEGDVESISTSLVWSLNGRVRELMLTGKNQVRSKVTDAYLAHLIKIGSMDSLAGLTLIFLLNVEKNNSEGLLDCADAITQTLVLLAPLFRAVAVDELLYKAYVERIFMLASHDGYTRDWKDYHYTSICEFLWRLASTIKARETGRSYNRQYYVLAALRGRFRWQKGEDLMPRKIPDERIGPPTEIGMQILANIKKLRQGLDSDSS